MRESGRTEPVHLITWRSVLIGLAGAVFISALQVAQKVTPLRALLPFSSVTTLLPGVVCLLFVVAILNAALKRWLPRFALTQAELLFIYVMQTASIFISSVGMLQFLHMGLANVFHNATPENGWEDYHPQLRRW